jgi:hypothetical protein
VVDFVWFCFCCTGGAGIGLASEDSELSRGLSPMNLECV